MRRIQKLGDSDESITPRVYVRPHLKRKWVDASVVAMTGESEYSPSRLEPWAGGYLIPVEQND